MATKAERFKAAEQRKRQNPGAKAKPKKPRGGRRLAMTADTAAPGVGADARRWGGESTGARNVSKHAGRKAAYDLEDSRATSARPSRKSTRKSGNRQKHGAQLRSRELLRTTSPRARAERATRTREAGQRGRAAD
jgi:hypothetical protein